MTMATMLTPMVMVLSTRLTNDTDGNNVDAARDAFDEVGGKERSQSASYERWREFG